MSYPTLKLGSRGPAVRAAKTAYNRWNAREGNTTAVYGLFFRPKVKGFQKAFGIPQTGVIGPATWKQFDRYLTARERERWLDVPRLVEPRHGWGSLRKDLWPIYSRGRSKYGLTDLGTYNPASRLPSGAPSDHAVYPAAAFDLGCSPATGWANVKARAFAIDAVLDPAVEYVILGDRINTKDGLGWRHYGAGGHLNHVHVSGRR